MDRHHRHSCLIIALGLSIASVTAACGDDEGGDQGARATTTSPREEVEPTVVSGAGDITATVEEYRNLLGPDNGGGPDQHGSGRREINWDAVPDQFAAPNALPPDFFNAPEAPRARGAVLATPGDHVAVSADADNPAGAAVRFGDLNPSYVSTFRAFSEERLFSPVGSNVVDLRFFLPGTRTPAKVRGFGAVYTDVDRPESAAFEFFDAEGKSLRRFGVPVSTDGLSFLGIAYPDAVVGRVRIVYGNNELGPDDEAQYDVAVMDDFIFGEPQPLRS
jgi:hypothetical protein